MVWSPGLIDGPFELKLKLRHCALRRFPAFQISLNLDLCLLYTIKDDRENNNNRQAE